MNKTIKRISGLSILCLVAALFLFPTAIALADGSTYTPLVSIPGIFTAGEKTNPVSIIKGIYGLAIGIGSVIATVMIIYAGFEYMYVESIMGKSAAKERIMNAFWGLLVILGSYILLRTINPKLVEFDLVLPGGNGNLSGLVVADKLALAREKSIHNALKKDAAAKAEISALQTTAASIEAQIAALEKQAAGVADPATRSKLDELYAKKQTINSQINEKTVAAAKDILSTLLHDGQDNVIANEIKALGTTGLGYKTSDAFNLILGRKDSTLTRLNSELEKVKALPETPNKADLVKKFEEDIASYKKYLTTSAGVIRDVQTIIEAPTTGGRQNVVAIVAARDTQLKQLAVSVESSAKQYEATQRPDLANQVRTDFKNSMLIAKAKYGFVCGTAQQTANFSICAQ